jgi:hypothetical protein
MNRRALELTGHFNQTAVGPVTGTRLAPVRELIAQSKRPWIAAQRPTSGSSSN